MVIHPSLPPPPTATLAPTASILPLPQAPGAAWGDGVRSERRVFLCRSATAETNVSSLSLSSTDPRSNPKTEIELLQTIDVRFLPNKETGSCFLCDVSTASDKVRHLLG